MGGTFRLLRVCGIDVRVEARALVVPAAVALIGLAEGPRAAGIRAAAVGILLGSLLLHELGHALLAKARGLPVLDVRLTAAGGVANIGRPLSRGGDPADEWVPALGGPLVGLLVAAVALVGRIATSGTAFPADARGWFEPLPAAFAINALMGVVNLLPVLPADGGRVLRALLSYRMAPLVATRVAAGVSVAVAAAAVIAAAVLLHPVLSPVLAVGGLLLAALARREVALARLRRRHEVFREFVAAHLGRFPALETLPRDAEGFPLPEGDALENPAVSAALEAYEAGAGPGSPTPSRPRART